MATISVSLHSPNKAKVEGREGTYWVTIKADGMDFCVFVKASKKAHAIADAINMEDDPNALFFR